MPPLSILMKPSSGNCNMLCDYCFYCDEMNNRSQSTFGFMTEETLKNVIRKTMLRAEGSITYAYQGGEPTLSGLAFFRKAIELQKKYNKNGIQVYNALQTNGYLIDEEWCRFFKENNFLIGVSLDGTKEIHDFYRHRRADRQGTYDRIMANIRLLEQYQVDFNILTVVTNKTAKAIKDIYAEYKKQGFFYQQYIECLDPVMEDKGSKSYSLQPTQFGQFMNDLFDLWYEDYLKGKQPYIRKFENYVGILAGYYPESCEQRGTCGIQNVVEADGSVYPCDFYMMDEYRLGNFNEERLPDINEKREEIGFIQRSLQVSKDCKACEYYSICRGGCQRNKIFYSAEDGYRSFYCEGYRMFFDHCIERLKEIAKTIK